MVLIEIPFIRCPTLYSDAQTLEQVQEEIALKTGLPISSYPLVFYMDGKKFGSNDPWPCDSKLLQVTLLNGLVGGKGGFGSMLRALGAQIEKTTNKEACRDLSGRRLRDINEEDRLKKYVSKQVEREQKEKEKKEAKLEKLRRLANSENKHEFHDPNYIKERENATNRVHDAMEAAFKSKQCSSSGQSGTSSSDEDVNKPSTSGIKRKIETHSNQDGPSVPKREKALWLGVDLTESDLESSSDEDE